MDIDMVAEMDDPQAYLSYRAMRREGAHPEIPDGSAIIYNKDGKYTLRKIFGA